MAEQRQLAGWNPTAAQIKAQNAAAGKADAG
jgi:hypothetical protein